jgi:hypothetical protein
MTATKNTPIRHLLAILTAKAKIEQKRTKPYFSIEMG